MTNVLFSPKTADKLIEGQQFDLKRMAYAKRVRLGKFTHDKEVKSEPKD